MDTITIDLKLLKNLGLNVNEYLTLLKIHLIDDSNPSPFPFSSSEKVVRSLGEKNWINFKEDEEFGIAGISMTDKAERLFDQEDLFQEFLETFPTRVPDGRGRYRPVSAASVDSKSAQTARHLWMKNVGKDAGRQRLVIDALHKELKTRESQGTLMYLNNMQTWLRQHKWEDWVDMPDAPSNSSNTKQL